MVFEIREDCRTSTCYIRGQRGGFESGTSTTKVVFQITVFCLSTGRQMLSFVFLLQEFMIDVDGNM